MKKVVFPFMLQRKCSGNIQDLNAMKATETIRLYKKIEEVKVSNEKRKDEIIAFIEGEIPNEEECRNKLINLKRDIYHDRFNKFINKDLVLKKQELWESIKDYQERIKTFLELKTQMESTFEEEVEKARGQIQDTYQRNNELKTGLRHVSQSAYEKIDKYIETPAIQHTSSYRKFDKTLSKVMTRATLKPSPFATFAKVSFVTLTDEENSSNGEKQCISRLEINDTFLLRLFNNFIRLPEIISQCVFSLQSKIAVTGDVIQSIYEYDKKTNSKVYGTSSRYIRIPYRGKIKDIFDALQNCKQASYQKLSEIIDSDDEDVVWKYICKCLDKGLLQIDNQIDVAQEHLLSGCISRMKKMSPEGSERCQHLIWLLERLEQVSERYNEMSDETEKEKAYKDILNIFKDAYACIEVTCPLENLVYEDYMDLNIGKKRINQPILDDLEWICKLSAIFDINLRTQLYFASIFKRMYGDQKVSYKEPRIMALLTNATKKYADMWTEEWKTDDGEDVEPSIKMLDQKKNEFAEYLYSRKEQNTIEIEEIFVKRLLDDIPESIVDRNVSMDFFIQELVDKKAVINNIYPGYLTFISRFIDYFTQEEFTKMKQDYIDEVYNKDYPIAEIYTKLENILLNRQDTVVVHVYITFSDIFIGPAREQVGDTCMDCFYHALENNQNETLLRETENSEEYELDLFSSFELQQVLQYVVEELEDGNNLLKGNVIRINRNDLTISKHHVLQYEHCDCVRNRKEVDMSGLHIIMDQEEICNGRSLRMQQKLPIQEIKKEIYDPLCGLICNIYKDMNSNFLPMICAEFNSSNGTIVNGAYGRAKTYQGSEQSAILEMIERYSNMWPKDKIQRIRSSYKDVKDKAVNPRNFILNNPEITGIKNDNFCEYSDDLEITWVVGFSMKTKENVLLPEQLVYFDIDEVANGINRFVFESSNGAALGGSLQEAALYGLFEIIERDAFLITWYNQLELPKIRIDSIWDEELRKMIQFIHEKQYDIYLFDSTMESRIPSIICIAVNKDDKSRVASYLAAGAHIDPIKAIEGALVEVLSSIPVYEKSFEGRTEEAKKLYENPELVLRMEDHILLYSLPECIKNYRFLLDSKIEKTMNELYPEYKAFKEERSITKILKYVVRQVTKYNSDVIIADCSNAITRKYNLYAVKVLVPGMHSITFGQQNKRINLERVKKIPVICGYRDTEIEDLNLYPHSFP